MLGNVMAEVIIEVAPNLEVVPLISRTSAEQFGLKTSTKVMGIIKSTEVMVSR
jgi:molybdopterin-binding protein